MYVQCVCVCMCESLTLTFVNSSPHVSWKRSIPVPSRRALPLYIGGGSSHRGATGHHRRHVFYPKHPTAPRTQKSRQTNTLVICI